MFDGVGKRSRVKCERDGFCAEGRDGPRSGKESGTVRERHGWFGRTACLLLAAGLLAQPALAFYPFGYFSPGGSGGNLIFVTWPFEVMDADGDGDISGDDDGVPLNFETGIGGFTEEEIVRLFFGYEEWERVGTSFAAFSRGQDLTDPVELEGGFDVIDGINAVALQTPTDPQIVTNATFFTIYSIVLEPMSLAIDNTIIFFTEPQFIDVDTVIDQTSMNGIDQSVLFGLESLATFSGGTILGLGNSGLTNVGDAPGASGFFEEEEVVTLRNFQGVLEPRGVTSSMFNELFVIDLGNGVFELGHHDLAVDDIAGITFLYPRSNSDLFFDIEGYARTMSTELIASRPIAGAWIRAYVNANNTSNRVPLVDTFTGLYTPPINPNDRNRFELKGLLKQMETPGGVTFQANYTLTSALFEPLHEFDPANNIDIRTSLDSTHGGFGAGDSPANYTGFGFDSLFQSEVFNESGNIIGQQNLSQGTPLAFDIVRREVVSTLSGLSLLEIVGPERIIFGDDGAGAGPSSGCPFNQIITAPATISGGGPTTPSALRSFRDNVLLNTALGAAVTDVYYRVSPVMARFIYEHTFASRMFERAVTGGNWIVRYPAVALFIAALLTLVAAFRKNRQARYAAIAVGMVAVAMAAFVSPAGALSTTLKTLTDYVDTSDYVVHGTVESVDSYWTSDGKRIVTDVTIRVDDSVKGRMNKGGLVQFQLPTGQVGAVVRTSPQLPNFAIDEEVVLFLQDTDGLGLGIVGGKRGKFVVKQAPDEAKYVGVMAPPPNQHLRQAAAEIKSLRVGRSAESESEEDSGEKAADDGPITLEEFKDYVRYLDRELRKEQR